MSSIIDDNLELRLNQEIIVPGLVVVDDHKRRGIVFQKEPRPSARWLSQLLHAQEMAALPTDVQWWGILPLSGGYVLCPEPLLTPVRPATYDDFLNAVEHGNEASRRDLAKLFPDFVSRARGAARPTRE